MSRRFAEANHPTLPNYRPEEPISYPCYLDANSLYATCQSFSLAVGDFRFLTQSGIDAFNVNSVSDQTDRGYILEVDLQYPEHLHDAHSAYPLCPKHLSVESSMISPTLEEMYEFVGGKHIPCDKLISNLRDNTFYVTHYRCLKFYLAHGMRLVRTHRICLLYTSPSPRDRQKSRMPSSA